MEASIEHYPFISQPPLGAQGRPIMPPPGTRVMCGGIGSSATMYVYEVTSLRARYSTRCGKRPQTTCLRQSSPCHAAARDRLMQVNSASMPRLGSSSGRTTCICVSESTRTAIPYSPRARLCAWPKSRLLSSAYSTTLPTCLVTVRSTRDRVPVSPCDCLAMFASASLAWLHFQVVSQPVYICSHDGQEWISKVCLWSAYGPINV